MLIGRTSDIMIWARLTDKVRCHEDLGKFLIVLVVHTPQRELLEVGLLPEPRQSLFTSLLVTVLALPFIEDKGGAAERFKCVLWLRCWWRLILVIISSRLLWLRSGSCLGSSLLLWLVLLGLWWRLVLDGSLYIARSLGHSSEDGLCGDSLIPADSVGILATPLLVEESFEAALQEGGGEEIGEGEALTNEVCVDKEMLFDDVDGLEGGCLGVLDRLLVVGCKALDGAEPVSEIGEDFLVGEGEPFEDGGVVLLGFAEEGCLFVLGCDYCAKSSY
jgi:hypothetical protein